MPSHDTDLSACIKWEDRPVPPTVAHAIPAYPDASDAATIEHEIREAIAHRELGPEFETEADKARDAAATDETPADMDM